MKPISISSFGHNINHFPTQFKPNVCVNWILVNFSPFLSLCPKLKCNLRLVKNFDSSIFCHLKFKIECNFRLLNGEFICDSVFFLKGIFCCCFFFKKALGFFFSNKNLTNFLEKAPNFQYHKIEKNNSMVSNFSSSAHYWKFCSQIIYKILKWHTATSRCSVSTLVIFFCILSK